MCLNGARVTVVAFVLAHPCYEGVFEFDGDFGVLQLHLHRNASYRSRSQNLCTQCLDRMQSLQACYG